MKRAGFAFVLLLAMPSAAQTASLTIAPDKQVYQVGETIALNVLGDPEGGISREAFGRILFDANLASHQSSSQSPLTTLSGSFTWAVGPLFGGAGFGDAFNQIGPDAPIPPDGSLSAVVMLTATAAGILQYSWDESTLDFFRIVAPPGGTVLIVPEPSTQLLLFAGLVAIGWSRTRSVRSRLRPKSCPDRIVGW